MVGTGSILTVGTGVRMVAIGEVRDSISPIHFLSQDRQHPLPRRLREVFTRDFGVDSRALPDQREREKPAEMNTHDERMGRVLSRREVMTLLGVSGAAWLLGESFTSRRASAGQPPPSCVIRPEQTEGPYFVDEQLNRSDIRSDPSTGQVKPGTPLTLRFEVMHVSAGICRPLSGALIDIWHCDALGAYSDVQDPGFNTLGQKFLRGSQLTDSEGGALFLTIYPGWYPIRTVHIHFKIRTEPVAKKSFEFTSQVYFPDELTDQVHAGRPYSSMGLRRVRNRQDFIFRDGGDRLMLAPTPKADGYATTFSIGLLIP